MRRDTDLPVPGQLARLGLSGAAPVFLRHSIYMVRMPLRIVGRLVILPLVSLGIFWGYAAGWSSPACLWMVGSGMGLFIVGFLFDTLLLWVSPERVYLET